MNILQRIISFFLRILSGSKINYNQQKGNNNDNSQNKTTIINNNIERLIIVRNTLPENNIKSNYEKSKHEFIFPREVIFRDIEKNMKSKHK